MQIIPSYFPDLSSQQQEQFELLLKHFPDLNKQVNMVSRKDIDELELRHVLHSLAIAKYIEFLPGTAVLDVGTGGGFPGIPLAILFPETKFLLVDSIGKKIKMVKELVELLGLINVEAEQQRAENIKQQFDFVVSRAVTQMPVFSSWMRGKLKSDHRHTVKNGIVYLKGGNLDEELNAFPKAVRIPIPKYFSEDFFETKQVVYLPWK